MSDCGCSLAPYQQNQNSWAYNGSGCCNSCGSSSCGGGCNKRKCGGCGHSRRNCRCSDSSSSDDDCCNRCKQRNCCCEERCGGCSHRYKNCSCKSKCGGCNRNPCCCRDKCGGCSRRKRDCCCEKNNCCEPVNCCYPVCIEGKIPVICGGNVIPPTSSMARGEGTLIINTRQVRLDFNIMMCNLSSAPISAGFYQGPKGSNVPGTLLFTLPPPVCCGNQYIWRDCWSCASTPPFSMANLELILNRQVYFQVLTTAYPTGESRGQLEPCYQQWENRCKRKNRGKCKDRCCCN